MDQATPNHQPSIQPHTEHNLYDPDHPEWFIYDVELLNNWYWQEFIKDNDL